MATRKEKMPSLKGAAFFRPETVDRENMTVEIVFTTGEAGLRQSWWSDPYEESLRVDDKSIRQERLKKGLSILDSHNRYAGIGAVLGVTEDYRIEKGQLAGTCRFSKNQQAVFDDVADGILRHVSLGYRIHEYKVTKPGKDTAIEQREAIDWEPLELSIVPVSFETTNGTRDAERAGAETYDVTLTQEETPMTEEERAAAAALKAQQEEANRTQPAAPAAPAAPTVNADEVRGETRAQLKPMLEAARAAGLDDAFATDAFADGTGIDAFRALVLDKMAETRKAGGVKSFAVDPYLKSDGRRDEGESLIRSAEEAIMVRARVKGATLTEGAREFSGRSMMEVARTLLVAQGVNVRGLSPQKIATRAMHSTSDFPLILENVMNKNLLDAYRETPRTFMGLGQASTANDFREKHLYRLGDAPSLKPLNENGEYQAGTFSEAKERYAIDTFARKIAFTRKMLINDDMGALDRMPRMFGPAGARLENDIVWGLLLNYDFINNKAGSVLMEDGKALFHADHANLLTTGSALSKASLTALRKLGRKMKTLDGQFMNVEYNAIAIPEDLETTAEDLLLPRIVAAKIEDQAPRQKMDIIVEPRLAVVDTAAWYAFSAMMDTFEYAHLAGEEEMYTEVNTNTDVDGLEVKVRKDFGAGLVDYRGMAKATGAA
uniref:prohead protease/major capsid protein fusion protein n=1 Tax=Marinobacterium profundum TaxID=1714300 RepID=UPI00082B9E0B|nr:prohead protease/major capsid protein fusion protein [Marinobacterium profundum]